MTILFSPSTRGFYPPNVAYDSLPDDLVEISIERHQELLAAQAAGMSIVAGPDGLPMPVEPAPQVPPVVSMAQARLALLKSGHLKTVNDALAQLPGEDGEAARIDWEFRATVERHSPLVAMLSAAIGLTDERLDELFVQASLL